MMPTNHLDRLTFSCSHNSFDVYDDALNPLDHDDGGENGERDTEAIRLSIERGCYRRGDAVHFRTAADGNYHRFDVFLSDSVLVKGNADRLIGVNLALPTGRFTVFGLDQGHYIDVPAGDYALYLRTCNAGQEDCDATDDDVIRRDDLERYEIILVPGRAGREGVLDGPGTVWGCVLLHRHPK